MAVRRHQRRAELRRWAMRWDRTENDVAKIAMRIDQSNAPAGGNVCRHEPLQQSRFPLSGLSDAKKVTSAVVGKNTAQMTSGAKYGFADHSQVRVFVRR